MSRRQAPAEFDQWLSFGRAVIGRARDDNELRHIEVWAELLGVEARMERLARMPASSSGERNLSPVIAAERLGISVRKLTRERFTVYRDICIPLEGQTRGYVVSERALCTHLARQRAGR